MKRLLSIIALGVALLMLIGCTATPATEGPTPQADADDPIKVGLLVAISGAGGIYGPPTEYVADIAIEEINEAGGINGRKLELVITDTASDAQVANEQAKVLLEKAEVDVIFMQATSAERNAALPVVENTNIMFFYCALYEGGAYSKYLFVNGDVPPQSVLPVLPYIMDEFDLKDWYIISNDYVWGRETSEIVRAVVNEEGGTLLAEDYVPLGTSEYSSVITKIQSLKPDGISCELIGSDVIAFIKQFHESGLSGSINVFCFHAIETAVAAMGDTATGLLTPVSYSSFIETEENKQFLEKYFEKAGKDAQAPDLIVVPTYDAMHLWALAANKAGSIEAEKVKKEIFDVSFKGPRGTISYEPETQHAELPIHLIEWQPDGSAKVIKDFGIISPK